MMTSHNNIPDRSKERTVTFLTQNTENKNIAMRNCEHQTDRHTRQFPEVEQHQSS